MYGYDSRVRLSEVDQDRRMTLNAILNSFQDCSSFILRIWEWELHSWNRKSGCGS